MLRGETHAYFENKQTVLLGSCIELVAGLVIQNP